MEIRKYNTELYILLILLILLVLFSIFYFLFFNLIYLDFLGKIMDLWRDLTISIREIDELVLKFIYKDIMFYIIFIII